MIGALAWPQVQLALPGAQLQAAQHLAPQDHFLSSSQMCTFCSPVCMAHSATSRCCSIPQPRQPFPAPGSDSIPALREQRGGQKPARARLPLLPNAPVLREEAQPVRRASPSLQVSPLRLAAAQAQEAVLLTEMMPS